MTDAFAAWANVLDAARGLRGALLRQNRPHVTERIENMRRNQEEETQVQAEYRLMDESLPRENNAGVYYDNQRRRADYCREVLATADATGMSCDDMRFLNQMLEFALNTGD